MDWQNLYFYFLYHLEGRDKFCKAIQYACRFLKSHYELKGDTQTSKKLDALFGNLFYYY